MTSSSTTRGYNPVDYWLAETTNIPEYSDILNSKPHHDHLRNISMILEPFMDEIHSIFEIGCGYGRITKHMLHIFPKIKSYHAIDISQFKIQKAIEFIPSEEYADTLRLFECNFMDWPAKTHYDLVIASEVLMHQLPDEIEKWINKMNSISRRYIMNIDYYESKISQPLARHNFLYDFGMLYKQLIPNCDVVTRKIESVPQRIYLVLK